MSIFGEFWSWSFHDSILILWVYRMPMDEKFPWKKSGACLTISFKSVCHISSSDVHALRETGWVIGILKPRGEQATLPSSRNWSSKQRDVTKEVNYYKESYFWTCFSYHKCHVYSRQRFELPKKIETLAEYLRHGDSVLFDMENPCQTGVEPKGTSLLAFSQTQASSSTK